MSKTVSEGSSSAPTPTPLIRWRSHDSLASDDFERESSKAAGAILILCKMAASRRARKLSGSPHVAPASGEPEVPSVRQLLG
jgi:hypothetical protein